MNPITKNSNTLFDKLLSKTPKSMTVDNVESTHINKEDYKINPEQKLYRPKGNGFTKLNDKQSNEYQYNLSSLEKVKNINYKGKVHICMYTLITTSIHPFLLYLLCKDGEKMKIPYLDVKQSNFFDDIERKISHITNNSEAVYKGQILFNNELYVFYNLEDNLHSINELNKNDIWWFTLITEICYLKKVLTFHIDNNVCNFFMENSFLCKLHDNNNNLYMSPHPLYYGSNMEYIENILAMGAYKNNWNADFGPFYNFGSYDIAIRYGGWSLKFKPLYGDVKYKKSDYKNTLLTDNEFGRYKLGGIVRFAIFIGNYKTVLNRPHDKEDNSRYANGANIIPEKRKIVDVEGKWAKQYDSVHKGELDIHQYNVTNQKGYTYVVKDFNQQYPLSYHKIDKESMGPMYEGNKIYTID